MRLTLLASIMFNLFLSIALITTTSRDANTINTLREQLHAANTRISQLRDFLHENHLPTPAPAPQGCDPIMLCPGAVVQPRDQEGNRT